MRQTLPKRDGGSDLYSAMIRAFIAVENDCGIRCDRIEAGSGAYWKIFAAFSSVMRFSDTRPDIWKCEYCRSMVLTRISNCVNCGAPLPGSQREKPLDLKFLGAPVLCAPQRSEREIAFLNTHRAVAIQVITI